MAKPKLHDIVIERFDRASGNYGRIRRITVDGRELVGPDSHLQVTRIEVTPNPSDVQTLQISIPYEHLEDRIAP